MNIDRKESGNIEMLSEKDKEWMDMIHKMTNQERYRLLCVIQFDKFKREHKVFPVNPYPPRSLKDLNIVNVMCGAWFYYSTRLQAFMMGLR